MITQTKNAKDAMIAAGFDKKDLRVRTSCDRGYYGVPSILVRASKEDQLSMIFRAAEQGIDVVIPVGKDGKWSYPDFRLHMGKGDAKVTLWFYEEHRFQTITEEQK